MTWVRVDDEMPQHAVLSGPNLFINNLNKTDNGTYRCEASNVVGKAHSDYTLYVYGTCGATLLPGPLTCRRCWQFTPTAVGRLNLREPPEAWPEVGLGPAQPEEGSEFPWLPVIAGLPHETTAWSCRVGRLIPRHRLRDGVRSNDRDRQPHQLMAFSARKGIPTGIFL